ncbi:MAG: NAD(+) synthase [candidate division Zixibacteria bacterium]|nr:NAD(+) synthase [candidate division Zixibacteria bacterium]
MNNVKGQGPSLKFNKESLKVNAEELVDNLSRTILRQIRGNFKKSGAVVGISGGIDSSVVAALCVRALGPKKVVGIMMPETDSSPESAELASELAGKFGFKTITENITAGLDGMGCYQRRDEAIRSVFPKYDSTYKAKIIIPGNILEKESFNFFKVAIENESGESESARLPFEAYLQVVAASNLKQRLRMTTLYYHAEKRNWAVVGTGNKDEHEQGFFVKYGDGGADLKPIAHLFKIQVYQLAEALDVPDEIIRRTPTTDTYSAEVTQEEFFFGLDFYNMDMLWYAMENDVPPSEAASVLGLTTEQAERAYMNIKRKIIATEYLRMNPLEAE